MTVAFVTVVIHEIHLLKDFFLYFLFILCYISKGEFCIFPAENLPDSFSCFYYLFIINISSGASDIKSFMFFQGLKYKSN